MHRLDTPSLICRVHQRSGPLTDLGWWIVLAIGLGFAAAAAAVALADCGPLESGAAVSSDLPEQLDVLNARLESLEQLDGAAVRLLDARRIHVGGWGRP